MSSGLSRSSSKKSLRRSFQNLFEKTRNLFDSSSRTTSEQSVSTITAGAHYGPPSPIYSSGSKSTNDSTTYFSVSSRIIPHESSSSAVELALDNSAVSASSSTRASIDEATHIPWDGAGELYDTGNSLRRPWNGLETALRGLHRTLNMLPQLQSSVGTLVSCLDVFQAAARHRQDCEALAVNLEQLIMLLDKHLCRSGSISMFDSVANVLGSLEKEITYIDKLKGKSTARGIIGASETADKIISCYRRIESLFLLLQIDADLSAWAITQDQFVNTRLEATSPAKAASFNSAVPANVVRRECTENTRTDVLSEVNAWSNDPLAAKVYWMNGMAGTGKTTIACSLSATLADRKQLGASFFCTKMLEECRDAIRIIPTIAYQLARYSRPFQYALHKVLENDPDISKRNIQIQFKRMLREPLIEVYNSLPMNIVVVIDALDECDDDGAVRTFLDTLFQYVVELPIKFFIAGRPEPEILDQMLSREDDARVVLHLHEIDRSSVQADIELYLRQELGFMSPTEGEFRRLVQLSDGLFIYAATVIRYVQLRKKSVNPRERLQTVLASNSNSNKMYAELDELYRTILEGALDDDDLEVVERDRFKNVLWTTVCAREPVAVQTLAALAGLEEENTMLVLQSLRSILHVSENNGRVTTLHASFPDFILSQDRSRHFFCDVKERSSLLAERCFEVMRLELRFNICHLESSFTLDSDILDLESRVETNISRPLSYACRHWGNHITSAIPTHALCDLLEKFFLKHLLHWMEVLNLVNSRTLGVFILRRVQSWLAAHTTGFLHSLPNLTSDAHDFVALFSSNPVSLSTPHIYISVLPFYHKSSLVYGQYWPRMQNLMKVSGTATEYRGTAAIASWDAGGSVESIAVSPDGRLIAFGGTSSSKRGMIGILDQETGGFVVKPFDGHFHPVNSVAFSPDGVFIASGCKGGVIRLWNARNGKPAAGPFRIHQLEVNSVVFSPDGTHIASGCFGGAIHVWRAHDGKVVTGSFQGHTWSVNSVAFSPDGTRVVSGSHDSTICVWSARSGRCIVGPLKRHTDSVTAVAFSPDGKYVASGSSDKTIIVWSFQGQELTAGIPFRGHTNSVLSVEFSPNGTRIVSGSQDNTICVWRVRDGGLIAGPLKGHVNWVRSVAFSPDGAQIVSGSRDNTICVWKAQIEPNRPTTEGFNGHTGPVLSVAFSPDGALIASGSHDNTICVWGSTDGRLVTGPIKQHTDWVNAVDFSPDGGRIVSGSSDRLIYIWGAHDGERIAGPFKGHTHSVLSVAFSPDGRLVVSGSHDYTARVWDSYDGSLVAGPFKEHVWSVNSVAFSPDGGRIVSGANDNTIYLWDARTGKKLVGPFHGHTKSVNSVVFSPDGTRIVSGAWDNSICIWSAQDGNLITGPFEGHTRSVNSVAFSPDGTRVVSGSHDNTICVWDSKNGLLLAGPYEGHTWLVKSVAFSPTNTSIVSGSFDSTIRCISLSPSALPDPALEGEWEVKASGWVVNRVGQLLFWVPQHLRLSLPRLYHSYVIGSSGSFQVDYSSMALGERWNRCCVGS